MAVAASSFFGPGEIADSGWSDVFGGEGGSVAGALEFGGFAGDDFEPGVGGHALDSTASQFAFFFLCVRPFVFGRDSVREVEAAVDQFGGREHSFASFDQVFVGGEEAGEGFSVLLDGDFDPLFEEGDFAAFLGVVLPLEEDFGGFGGDGRFGFGRFLFGFLGFGLILLQIGLIFALFERLRSFGFDGGGTFLCSLELHAFAEAAAVEAFQVVEGAVELAFGLAQVAAEAFQAVVLLVGPVQAVGLFLMDGVFALVVAAAIAEDDPLRGDGFAYQLVDGVGVGAVVVEPAFEQLAEFVGVFVGEEEGFGAAAVLEGVLAGAFFTFFRAGSAAGAAGRFGWRRRRCFGFRIEIEIGHEASFACGAFGWRSGNELSDWCGGRRQDFGICDGWFWRSSAEGDLWFFTKRTPGWVRF